MVVGKFINIFYMKRCDKHPAVCGIGMCVHRFGKGALIEEDICSFK